MLRISGIPEPIRKKKSYCYHIRQVLYEPAAVGLMVCVQNNDRPTNTTI